uniref:Transcription factor n=1 Tax=Lycoris longituba TaxID=272140 RepID=D6MKE6_9ASPA
MASLENSNWVFDYPLINNISVTGGDFGVNGNGILWTPEGINFDSNASVEDTGNLVDTADLKESKYFPLSDMKPGLFSVEDTGKLVDAVGLKEFGSKKRVRSEASSIPGSKACREKMRRDRLNDKFLELGSILEPENPKTDKAAILSDAVRMVNQLRSEAQKLKDSNENLQEKIKELKAEKNELRDEKQRLKQEKENLEQQVKLLNARPSFMPHPPVIPTAFAAAKQGQAGMHHKLMMSVVGYHGYNPMWQFMPPADVDTSLDAESCPPVA